ncbi:MAG: ATP-grasp domain-containing protein [Clostridiales bacterium]|nr:ATP-grasp domain-containing protein [Clostridiales bacterium]
MRIIIDSTDKRMTVPAIDCLARAGYAVHGLCFNTDRPLNPGKLEKIHYISRRHVAGDLEEIFSGYTSDDILIAGNPVVIEAVNTIKPRMKYLLSSQESIEKAADKKQMQKLAGTLEIKVPRELKQPAFPMVAKLNVSENTGLKPAERYRIIRNEKDLEAARPFISQNAGNLIIQEYADGPSAGVSMLLDEQSNLVDFIVHERLLEYPVTGGPSAACRCVINASLAQSAYRLLRALDWKGIAMVEFKGDALIEINPRFWGSMPLLFMSKSDFFFNYIKVLEDDYTVITPEQVPYQPGGIMTYFPQGLLSVLSLMKSGKIGKAARGLKTLLQGKEGIFRFSNPGPFFRYLRSLATRNSV